MSKYWESEQPIEVKTDKNVLKYYKEAGQLAVCRPDFTDTDGNSRQGKTVVLNASALLSAPDLDRLAALEVFRDILARLEA